MITKGIIAAVVLILAVVFTSIAFPNFERVHWYRQIIITIATPPQMAITTVTQFIGGVWHHYIALTKTSAENDRLKIELQEKGRRLIELENIKMENKNLRELFEMAESAGMKNMGAEVIALDVMAEFKTATINKGADHGIRKNMVVMAPGGVIGRIGQVASKSSTVLLISDPNSAVDVFVQPSGARALLIGTAGGTALRPFFSLSRLEYLKHASEIENGNVVVTNGLDKLFPKGIPVGTIYNIEDTSGIFKNAEVVPFADLSRLREVTVLK